jgi:hypothetical protein
MHSANAQAVDANQTPCKSLAQNCLRIYIYSNEFTMVFTDDACTLQALGNGWRGCREDNVKINQIKSVSIAQPRNQKPPAWLR